MKAKSATRERATKPAFAKRSTSLSSPTKLKIGLPKGSLQEATAKLFGRAGFSVVISERSYMPSIDDPELEPMLLRAQEMSRYVEGGLLDCGITGHDWILENGSQVQRVAELRYAKRTAHPVRWVLAVAAASPIRALSDLNGKRIATELVHVTKSYLATHGVRAKVEFSWGATEGKVRAGLVDAVVELTETGQTLIANGLRIIETICQSTTQFIANRKALADPWKRRKIESLKTLLLGAVEAEGKVGVKLNVSKADLKTVISVLPAMKRPTVSQLWKEGAGEDWWAIEVVIDECSVKELVPKLKAAGARDIIEYPLNKVIY
ncbi:MAG TPA: ATP phosphoribosyltransferase [Candidatus Omnitrophica bacterium]|nr:ATP phosphoribosyltransferase [Candidatus Omnitrophota bacterium]HBH97340.1 ATP phosphoribosyltransferase [Candidatus Omnitrophota bacterium]HBQ37712.1 ATP phosphoribosyltransferase [Candidatus Omnitrophota bacterium]